MTTRTIRNGATITVPVETGETLKIVAVTGTYTATIVRGTGIGTALATAATGGSYGPYAYAVVVSIAASAASEIDFDVATVPSVVSDSPVAFSVDVLGKVAALQGADGREVSIFPAAGLLRVAIMADSMGASAAGNSTITSLTRSNNVVTGVLTTHGRGTGEICSIYNCLDTSFNANDVAVTRVDANTFTYPSIGADGSTADLVAVTKPMQLQSHSTCNDNSFMFWLQSKTGAALKLVRNAGRSGHNSADMLARYDADIVNGPAHDAVFYLTGYNDWVTAGYTADQVYANVVDQQAKSPGKLFVIISSIPWTTGGTAANRKEALKYNRKIRAFCASRPNVRFADAAKYLIDATNATAFSPLTGMLQSDGIHPSPKGAERIAQAIYDAIQYDCPRVSRLVSCSLDTYANDSTCANILDAGPWTTSGGALAGGATGTVAASMAVTLSGSGTAVASVVARANGIGYDQQVVFTPAANNDSVTFSGTGYITGRTSDGQKLNYLGELILAGMSGANIKSVEIYVTHNGANSTHYLAKAQAANAAAYPSSDMTIDFASLIDSIICTGHTGIGWNVVVKAGAAGTALTIKLGQQSIEKVA